MTSTADALMAAILAHPAEDTPRLVYADWLDENAGDRLCQRCGGDGRHRMLGGSVVAASRCTTCDGRGRMPDGCEARAWLIRHQPRVHLFPEGSPATFPLTLDGRLHVTTVADGIPGVALGVRRGFVDEVECPLAAWLARGPAVVRAYPVEVVRDCGVAFSQAILPISRNLANCG